MSIFNRLSTLSRNRRKQPSHHPSRDMIGANFLEDIEATRYYLKKKSERVLLQYRQELAEIRCMVLRTKKIECSVSLEEIKEIRPGKNSKDFEKWIHDTKKLDPYACFVIFYGTDFRLKTLSISVESKKDAENWIKCLEYLMNIKHLYLEKLDFWILKEFDSLSKLGSTDDGVSLKQMRAFTNRISFKISTGKLHEKFLQRVNTETGCISQEKFMEIFFIEFLHDQQIFTDCFGKYSLGGKIKLSDFEQFLKEEQHEHLPLIDSSYNSFFRDFKKAGSIGMPYMTSTEAVNFLFSKQNQIWNKSYDGITQDMSRPLSHYWIASSHNTYLTGSQLSSESSIEAYARCLRMGCRCIELDCWDGPNGLPIIYHGLTLTTKIPFIEVIKAIRDHAFVTSDYPVILSIENHCSVKQQKIMAKKFEEVFDRMLIKHPIFKDETELPSPDQLKRRIILKCKTLPKNDNEKALENNSSNHHELDLCHTVKNGKMYIPTNNNSWEPYFFALTNEKLLYTEIEQEQEKDVDQDSSFRRSVLMTSEDLHFSKKWFHGRIAGGLRIAEERVQKFGIEGSFLVRQSATFPGEFSLCFLSQGKAHHIRIKNNPEQTKYYLVASKTFDSLYSLISHYRKNPLETKDFALERFTIPVPQPEKHESEPWFYPNERYPDPMDRKAADQVLQRIPLNGAFLVRYSSEPSLGGRFVISFRIEKQIKHCRINEDGRLLIVNSTQKFENIEKLIQFYSTRAFYKGLKLKHPVNDELMKFAKTIENTDKVYTNPDYLDTSIPNASVRAIRSQPPEYPNAITRNEDQNMLRFSVGSIITNVVKLDSRWWIGDYGDQEQCYFPSDYVQEIEPIDSPFGELQKGSVFVGKTEIEKCNDENHPYLLKISYPPDNPVPFKAAVRTYREAKEWQEVLNYVYSHASTQITQNDMLEKKRKIANEFSRLIVYCCAVPRVSPDIVRSRGRIYNEMASYTEITAENQMGFDPMFYVWYHEIQFSRVYPKGQRVDSSNYYPMRFWNYGCQMVALNYQTPDLPMQLNHGRFRLNGRCGYVLRPEFMFKKNFDPTKYSELVNNDVKALNFQITVIAARYFIPGNKPITKPRVEIEVFGADFDCQHVKTKKLISENGLNPFWNERFSLKVLNPDLALIRFALFEEDSFGDTHLLGQATYPVRCLRQGYRSVPLENGFGEELLSSLLVRVTYFEGN